MTHYASISDDYDYINFLGKNTTLKNELMKMEKIYILEAGYIDRPVLVTEDEYEARAWVADKLLEIEENEITKI